MKHKLIVTIFFLVLSQTASAADIDCKAIDNDLDRLACYDKQSGRNSTETKIETTSSWAVRSETSEFKDTTDVFVSTDSDDTVPCGYSGPRKVSMMVRCMENTTSVYFSSECHVASGFSGYGNVEYRVNDKKAVKKGFQASTDNSALGLWSGRSSIPFIKSLLGGKRLLIRFTPFNESPVTASFDISGIDTAVQSLRKACNW